MIEGAVNAASQAIVGLVLRGPSGQARAVDAVVDTGFDRFLTLPPAMVTDLDLAFAGYSRVVLADGSDVAFAGYSRVVLADGSDVALDSYAVAGYSRVVLADGSDVALDTVLWDGRPRRVVAYVSEAAPLVGMALLAGYQLCVDVEDGGRVVIEASA